MRCQALRRWANMRVCRVGGLVACELVDDLLARAQSERAELLGL